MCLTSLKLFIAGNMSPAARKNKHPASIISCPFFTQKAFALISSSYYFYTFEIQPAAKNS